MSVGIGYELYIFVYDELLRNALNVFARLLARAVIEDRIRLTRPPH